MARFHVRLQVTRYGIDETSPGRVTWGGGRNVVSIDEAIVGARELVAALEADRAEQVAALPEIVVEVTRVAVPLRSDSIGS